MTNFVKRLCGSAALGALAVAGTASAQDYGTPEQYTTPGLDYARMSLSGIVEEADDTDSFILDYGDGTIEVETGDIADFNPQFRLNPGEDVTVYGEFDDEFFEGDVFEAEDIYIDTRSMFYASSDQPQVDPLSLPASRLNQEEGTLVTFIGDVARVNDREFTLNTGGSTVSVDTVSMSTNPLDDVGQQQVDRGDTVVVTGAVDQALFDERELSAMVITSFGDNSDGQNSSMASNRNGSDRNRGQQDRRQSRYDDNSNRSMQDQRSNESRYGSNDRGQQDDRYASSDDRQRSRSRDDDRGGNRNSGDRDSDRSMSDRRSGDQRQSQSRSRSQGDMDNRSQEGSNSGSMSMGREYAMLDQNDNGVVSRSEYIRVVSDTANITRSEARQLFEAAARGDGELTREEFLRPSEEYERLAEEMFTDRDQNGR